MGRDGDWKSAIHQRGGQHLGIKYALVVHAGGLAG